MGDSTRKGLGAKRTLAFGEEKGRKEEPRPTLLREGGGGIIRTDLSLRRRGGNRWELLETLAIGEEKKRIDRLRSKNSEKYLSLVDHNLSTSNLRSEFHQLYIYSLVNEQSYGPDPKEYHISRLPILYKF